MRQLGVLAGLVVAAMMLGVLTVAEPASSAGASVLQEQEQQPNKPKRSRFRRLLPYWGKIDLSDDQRETIYDIREKYGEKIAALEEQIEQLQAEQHKAMVSVLTDEQLQRLDELLAEARQRREQRRQAREEARKRDAQGQ